MDKEKENCAINCFIHTDDKGQVEFALIYTLQIIQYSCICSSNIVIVLSTSFNSARVHAQYELKEFALI